MSAQIAQLVEQRTENPRVVGSIPITRFRKFLLHFHEMYVIMLLRKSSYFVSLFMREWLSGGVSPCQGEGRGFESRLALFLFNAGIL